MSDLVNGLRRGPYHEPEGVEPKNEEQVWNWWCEITDAAAYHIEAQGKLIQEMREALEIAQRFISSVPEVVTVSGDAALYAVDTVLSKAKSQQEGETE